MFKINLIIAALIAIIEVGTVQLAPTGTASNLQQTSQDKPSSSMTKSESTSLEPVKLTNNDNYLPSGDYMAKGFDLADHVVTDYEFERVLEKLRREAYANEQIQAQEQQSDLTDDRQELNFNKNSPSPSILGQIIPAESVATAEFSTTDCPICLEPLEADNRVAMQCGHVFHPKCISRWSDYVSCPKCETSTGGMPHNDQPSATSITPTMTEID